MGTLLVGAVLVAVIAAAVYKLRKDKKEGKDANAKKDSRALEVGSVIISGAAAVSYFVFLFLAQ